MAMWLVCMLAVYVQIMENAIGGLFYELYNGSEVLYSWMMITTMLDGKVIEGKTRYHDTARIKGIVRSKRYT
jgi:hypothetical protein